MKPNADQDLSRILAGIRDIEAPAGMQQRVMAAVERREAVAPSRSFAWAFAALAAAAVVAAVFAVRLMPHISNTPPVAAVRLEASRAPVHVQAIAPRASTTATAIDHHRLPPLPARPHPLLCDCDPIALAEANAPSLPAPELPLTEQEKLLRRVGRHPDSAQVAELTSAGREARIAADHDDFKNFFTPPPATPVDLTENP